MIKLVVLVSFFLDGLLSIYQGPSFFDIISFKPMFTVVSLVLIYPWYRKNHREYYKICLIAGLAYDIFYTGTLLLNMLLFLLIGFITYKLYSLLAENFFTDVFVNVTILLLYHLVTFIILALIGYVSFDILTLSHNSLGIIITNTVFFIVANSILRLRKDKKKQRTKYHL